MLSSNKGWMNGFIGVSIFSASLPATRFAVMDFDPIFLTACRTLIAAFPAFLLLFLTKQPRPQKADLIALFFVALGCVVGFPLLTGFALQYISSAHSIVYLGLLPLATALFAVVISGERPKPFFWLFAGIGSCSVIVYALSQSATSGHILGDILMLLAVILCGLGYAEGATLAHRLGGWQVICWALLLSIPFILPFCFYAPPVWAKVSFSSWLSLFYVGLFSMLLGFVFWYKGLVQGGIARVGQLQLLQPFMGLGLSAGLLHEQIQPAMLITCVVAMVCVFGVKKMG